MSVPARLAAGRYRLMDKVGEGGMAVVYRAMDELLGRVVAVKMLREQYTADREFVERFRREAQAAARLSHPHVVQVFDVGQDHGTHYIVMEFVDGKSLKEVLRERGRLEPAAAAGVAMAVARALGHAHRHGLIHRDIKPHNILITAEGLVKVADFGIARAASASSLTDSGIVLGSVHYFSPEQARGQSIGAASDIYSLGVVLYEMLAGRVPFTAESPVAVALKHIYDPVPPLREAAPGVPAALERCVLHALAKSPGQRPESADAFYEELRRALPEAEEFSAIALVQPPDAGAAAGPVVPAAGEEPLRQPPPAADGAATRVVARPLLRQGPGPEDGAEEPTRPAGHHAAGNARQREAQGAATRHGAGRRSTVRWAFLAAFAAGVLWAAVRLVDLAFPQEVMVPDVVGRAEAEAGEILARQGLQMGVDQEVYSNSVPAGHVIRQDPEAGRRVREGRKVWVTLSRGPEMGVVPDVVGRHLREAQVMITQSGFVLGEVTARYQAGLDPNTVVLQEPAAGTPLEKGRPVRLVVSRGDSTPASVRLPDFTGLPLEQVQERLERLGLRVGTTWAEYDPNFPAGTVIDQNPMPGSDVEQGSAVDLVYSQGPPPAGMAALPARPGPAAQPEAAGGLSGAPGPAGTAGAGSVTERPGTGAGTPVKEGVPGSPAAASPGEPQGKWRVAEVHIQVPPGGDQEVVILVIDDFGASEAYRRVLPGGTYVTERVRGRGASARFQVYIDGRMVTDEAFPPQGQG